VSEARKQLTALEEQLTAKNATARAAEAGFATCKEQVKV